MKVQRSLLNEKNRTYLYFLWLVLQFLEKHRQPISFTGVLIRLLSLSG